MEVVDVTAKLWEISDIVAPIEAKEAEEPLQRGPYTQGQGSFAGEPQP